MAEETYILRLLRRLLSPRIRSKTRDQTTSVPNLGYIKAGIEIVPVKSFADEMSTGVSFFEQFVWDLENRGVADIDVPVLIYGIDADTTNGGNGALEKSNQIQMDLK